MKRWEAFCCFLLHSGLVVDVFLQNKFEQDFHLEKVKEEGNNQCLIRTCIVWTMCCSRIKPSTFTWLIPYGNPQRLSMPSWSTGWLYVCTNCPSSKKKLFTFGSFQVVRRSNMILSITLPARSLPFITMSLVEELQGQIPFFSSGWIISSYWCHSPWKSNRMNSNKMNCETLCVFACFYFAFSLIEFVGTFTTITHIPYYNHIPYTVRRNGALHLFRKSTEVTCIT